MSVKYVKLNCICLSTFCCPNVLWCDHTQVWGHQQNCLFYYNIQYSNNLWIVSMLLTMNCWLLTCSIVQCTEMYDDSENLTNGGAGINPVSSNRTWNWYGTLPLTVHTAWPHGHCTYRVQISYCAGKLQVWSRNILFQTKPAGWLAEIFFLKTVSTLWLASQGLDLKNLDFAADKRTGYGTYCEDNSFSLFCKVNFYYCRLI